MYFPKSKIDKILIQTIRIEFPNLSNAIRQKLRLGDLRRKTLVMELDPTRTDDGFGNLMTLQKYGVTSGTEA